MRDTNFAEEQVYRIDKEVDKVFPELENFLMHQKLKKENSF